MKKLIVFDMDGTLADTSPGILNSHRYAHAQMGRPQPETAVLCSVIGGPLLQTYENRFGFSEEEARKALVHYRRYYAQQGLLEAELYPGMEQTLKALKVGGYQLAVATLKAEAFVETMLRHMGVASYFDAIYGMDPEDSRTKTQLIRMCMAAVGATPEETVMVGDSIHDRTGAEAAGVGFIGVTYGFGFTAQDRAGDLLLCDTPTELISRLLDKTE